jgi:predicted amidophosphoribosyltransferase
MIKLEGPWEKGYAFDIHSIESVCTGYNAFGYPTFDTTRSPMGQCIYELKYGQHLPVIDKIVDLLIKDSMFSRFIKNIDIILPVPPSNKYRQIQPVLLVSNKLAEKFKKEIRSDVLSSANKDELKNVATDEKYAKIKKTIKIDAHCVFRLMSPPNSGGSRHLIPLQSATP